MCQQQGPTRASMACRETFVWPQFGSYESPAACAHECNPAGAPQVAARLRRGLEEAARAGDAVAAREAAAALRSLGPVPPTKPSRPPLQLLIRDAPRPMATTPTPTPTPTTVRATIDDAPRAVAAVPPALQAYAASLAAAGNPLGARLATAARAPPPPANVAGALRETLTCDAGDAVRAPAAVRDAAARLEATFGGSLADFHAALGRELARDPMQALGAASLALRALGRGAAPRRCAEAAALAQLELRAAGLTSVPAWLVTPVRYTVDPFTGERENLGVAAADADDDGGGGGCAIA